MNCLLVIAHPQDQSLCRSLAAHTWQQLEAQGHSVVVEDLYEQSFDPAFTTEEKASYSFSCGGALYDRRAVEDYAVRLQQADALILVYPTWWFSFPAILKGWFDRVWVPGTAYTHSENFGPIKPNLKALKQVLAITTLGSPWWVDRLLLRQPLKRILKTSMIGTCTRDCRLTYLSHYLSETTDNARFASLTRKIDKTLKAWR